MILARLSKSPIPFESPVSYREPGGVVKDEDLGDYDFEDDDDEDFELMARAAQATEGGNEPE